MALALKFGADFGIPDDCERALSQLYQDLTAASRLAEPLATARRAASEAERRRVEAAAKAWRALAADAKRVLQRLQLPTGQRLNGQFLDDNKTLTDFLAEAVAGRTTRIGDLGEIALPVLRQRRSAPRVAIRGACRLHFDGAAVPAELFDVSLRGLGLRCRTALDVDKAVTIELPDGRRLNATVARQDGERLGLRLDKPLGMSDPLLQLA